ncbi:hypothetical protein D3C81_416590 [compost metagenome]|uniref:Glycosyltransferase family 39 protein n=1 Tax=Serratia liquefaciens TaxID=614 RepID=A0ABX7DD31_SERLI|nr:glycosyltransferase family 39 protein [Serratia liquefaciens]QQU58050.1 glycosyltransferase family 39 protein [Serratia liquefaciens]
MNIKSKIDNSHNKINIFKYNAMVFFILLLSTVIRFCYLTNRYFWCDEASSILTSRYEVPLLLYHASFDVHPPLYYLLLHYWIDIFNDSIFSARSLSVLFGVITVALVIKLTRCIINERAALLAGWLISIMPVAVRYSQEARMYALMGMLTIAAALALVMWLKNPTNKRYLCIYTLLMVLSFYTHYFTIFALVAHWLTLVILSIKQSTTIRYLSQPIWWLANLIIIIAYLPWLMVLINLLSHISELRVGGDVGWIPNVTWRDLPAMYWRFITGSNGLHYPSFIHWAFPVFLISMAFLFQYNLCHSRILVLCNLTAPIILVFLISWFMPLFIDRYLFFASINIPVILASLITQCRIKRLRISFLLGLTIIFGFGVYNEYPKDKDRFMPLVDYIDVNYQPNDVVVVDSMFNYLSYVYYNKKDYQVMLYTGPNNNKIIGRPNEYGFGTFFHAQASKVYIDKLIKLNYPHRRVWLVSTSDVNQAFGHLPVGWRQFGAFTSGEFEVRVFLTNNS